MDETLDITKKKKHENKLKLENLEENILRYNSWLRDTNREDKIENYEMFLQAQ